MRDSKTGGFVGEVLIVCVRKEEEIGKTGAFKRREGQQAPGGEAFVKTVNRKSAPPAADNRVMSRRRILQDWSGSARAFPVQWLWLERHDDGHQVQPIIGSARNDHVKGRKNLWLKRQEK